MFVDSSHLDRNTVAVHLAAYYLDCFVLGVHLGNSILAALVSMKDFSMKCRHHDDAVLFDVVHRMAEVCRHFLTIFYHSDPVNTNTADDH